MKKKYSPLKKSPLNEVKLTQDEYLKLVEKIKKGTANKFEHAKGQNGLFLKYCHCIRKSQALEKKKPKSKRGRYLPKAEVPELRITDGYPERDSQPMINERFLMDVSGYKGN